MMIGQQRLPIGSNFDSVLPMGKVKRWSAVEKNVSQNYNKSMVGVDQADQFISLYPTAVRGKKWWWVLFTYMLDLTVAKSWRRLDFRRYIARNILKDRNSSVSMHPAVSAVPSLQNDGVDHYPQKLSQRLRCAVCHKKTGWQCKKCCKTLSVEKNCSESFHTT